MTTFIVNEQERQLRYNVNGIDTSQDFIGNTAHGMGVDEEGRYIASPEDFEWWEEVISAHEVMNAAIATYKERFDADEVDKVVNDWSGGDYDTEPKQVILGLRGVFGSLPR